MRIGPDGITPTGTRQTLHHHTVPSALRWYARTLSFATAIMMTLSQKTHQLDHLTTYALTNYCFFEFFETFLGFMAFGATMMNDFAMGENCVLDMLAC